MRIHKLPHGTLAAALVCLICGIASCGSGSGVQGTYVDASGNYMLDIQSGGKASLGSMGQSVPCTYEADKNKLSMNCQGQTQGVVFTLHDDGSLTGPPELGIPALKKKK